MMGGGGAGSRGLWPLYNGVNHSLEEFTVKLSQCLNPHFEASGNERVVHGRDNSHASSRNELGGRGSLLMTKHTVNILELHFLTIVKVSDLFFY